MPLTKVMVPMLKVTPTIGAQESEAAFDKRIVNAANLLVDNYNIIEHNAYKGHRHGQLNHVFELVSLLCRPRLEPNVRSGRK
jgi:hypothetical protein